MSKQISSNSKILQLQHTQQQLKKHQPYKVILSFSLVGISALFIAILVASIFSMKPDWQSISLPQSFILSTFFIVGCSIALQLANIAFQKDKTNAVRALLAMTFLGGIGFIMAQAIGWEMLRSSGVFFQNSTSGSYVYLISGLHALHVMAGLIFFGIFALDANKYLRHPATALVFFTDPVKKLRLELLTIYWHFMDAVWLVIFLFLAVNFV